MCLALTTPTVNSSVNLSDGGRGSGKVTDLEESGADWGRAPTRTELHESFDVWLDTLEEAVTEKSLSLDSLAREVLARRPELTCMVTEALAQRRHRQALYEKTAPYPQCARLLLARALVPRTVETLVGEASFDRAYFWIVTLSCWSADHASRFFSNSPVAWPRRRSTAYLPFWSP
jgi:hypothetical protein